MYHLIRVRLTHVNAASQLNSIYPCGPINSAGNADIEDGRLYVEGFDVQIYDPYEDSGRTNPADLYLYFPDKQRQTEYVEVDPKTKAAKFAYAIQLVGDSQLDVEFYDANTFFDRYMGGVKMEVGADVEKGACVCMRKAISQNYTTGIVIYSDDDTLRMNEQMKALKVYCRK